MKRYSKRRELVFAAVFLVLTALLIQLASAILRPPHTDYGSTWGAYLAEPEDSIDVLYLGSSYAYCDINPALIYEDTGLTGYVMGASQQTTALNYHYLKEALRTQSPSAVVLEASGLFFPQLNQEYTQVNVGYMPFGLGKLGAIFSDATEAEMRPSLLFDLYSYHDRWKTIQPEAALQALKPIERDHLKGYTTVGNVLLDLEKAATRRELEISPQRYAENLAHLADILSLCREENIQLILTLNPAYTQFPPEVYEKALADVRAIDPGVPFYNLSDSLEAIGLDPKLHLLDGWHLNQDGATIFSRWLGQLLKEAHGLVPMPQTAENAAAWAETVGYWNSLLAQ